MADQPKLTFNQCQTLRRLNEQATGPEAVHFIRAQKFVDAGLAERVPGLASGRKGFSMIRLTEAGVRAANELVGGSAAA